MAISVPTTPFAGNHVVGSIRRKLSRGLAHMIRVASRQDQIDQLQAMSDVELARLGIARDEIVHHVFRDRMYI